MGKKNKRWKFRGSNAPVPAKIYTPTSVVSRVVQPLHSMEVVIDFDVYQKVMYWVHKAANHEVSGFGNVVQDGSQLKIVSACLCKQENTSTTTDIEPADLAKAQYESRNLPGSMRWWWHSHVQMPAFWSGTDEDNIRALGANGWFLCTVFNQKYERKTCFITNSGLNGGLFIDDIPLQFSHYVMPDDKKKELDAEYDEKVKTKSYVYTGGRWDGGGYRDWMGMTDGEFSEYYSNENIEKREKERQQREKVVESKHGEMPNIIGATPSYGAPFFTLHTAGYGKVYIDRTDLKRGDVLASPNGVNEWLRVELDKIYLSAIKQSEKIIKECNVIPDPAYELQQSINLADDCMLEACDQWLGAEKRFFTLEAAEQQQFLDQFLEVLSLSVCNARGDYKNK